MPGDNEEKQAIPQQVQPSPSAQAQARLLEEEILLTSSSFFPNQRPPSSARRSGEGILIRILIHKVTLTFPMRPLDSRQYYS